MLRELAETYYQFDEPFVLDITKCESVFGACWHPAGRRHRRDRGLVPDPAGSGKWAWIWQRLRRP
jgi:hypothetical protein